MSLEEKILSRITSGTSFVEFLDVPGVSGDTDYIVANEPNIVIWPGLSNEAIAALESLKARGLIAAVPTSPLVYFHDGMYPNLPIVKGVKKYKTPHWLPVVFGKTELGREKRKSPPL